MKVKIIVPSVSVMETLVKDEKRHYLSSAIEVSLKKFGIQVNDSTPNIVFFTRGTSFFQDSENSELNFIEGPFDKLLVEGKNTIAGQIMESEINIYDSNKEKPINVCYNSYFEKRIPSIINQKIQNIIAKLLGKAKFDHTIDHQCPYISKMQMDWGDGVFRITTFAENKEFRVLNYVKINDEFFPVAVKHKNNIYCGFPLLDLICWQHTMPDLEVGYYSCDRYCDSEDLETLVLRLIEFIKPDGSSDELLPGSWPKPYRAGFIVRHDYDRVIEKIALKNILDFYEEEGVKATWFWLRKTFDAQQILEVIERGHEVAIHTEAHFYKDFLRNEFNYMEKKRLFIPEGASSHGGAGGVGNLGNRNLEWYRKLGLKYGEILGNQNRVGHNSIKVVNGVGYPSKLFLPPVHYSLDLGMRDDQHDYFRLKKRISAALLSGHCCIVMNHPDIHIKQLLELIKGLDLSSVKKMTLSEYSKSRIILE